MNYEVKAKKDVKSQLIYVAYCIDCNKSLAEYPNGSFAESVAEQHTLKTGHDTLVGFTFGRWLKGTVKKGK